jgi:hypothetical protein
MRTRRVLFSAPLWLILASGGYAQSAWKWDGTWTGMLQNRASVISPMAITIAKGKVVNFSLRGAPFDIQYSKVTSDDVQFGDRDHYSVRLKRTSDGVAATLWGRSGSEMASLAKQ